MGSYSVSILTGQITHMAYGYSSGKCRGYQEGNMPGRVYPRRGEKNLRIIPDMFSRDQRGIILTYDTMITRADYQANRALFAADAGEKMKRDKYNKHINECIKNYATDSCRMLRNLHYIYTKNSCKKKFFWLV